MEVASGRARDAAQDERDRVRESSRRAQVGGRQQGRPPERLPRVGDLATASRLQSSTRRARLESEASGPGAWRVPVQQAFGDLLADHHE